MADRTDYFFRMKVTEAELDLAFDLLEKADRNLAADIGVYGIISGAEPTPHAPVSDLTIELTAPGRAYDNLGQQIFFGTGQTVDCSVDHAGIPTEVPVAGQERWLGVFLRFDRLLSDPRTDGNSQQVFFRRDESFEIVVRQGAAAVDHLRARRPHRRHPLLDHQDRHGRWRQGLPHHRQQPVGEPDLDQHRRLPEGLMATRIKPVPRETLSARIETLSLPQAKTYADFIRAGDPDGPIPCWGAIAERFDTDFKQTDERKALWNVLVEAEDRRPLLLFLHMNHGRPDVMAKVLDEAHRLPPVLQRALVSFDEVAADVSKHLDRLDPAARQLWEAGPDAIARERALVEARVNTLLSFRYFVPDETDPADERAHTPRRDTDV